MKLIITNRYGNTIFENYGISEERTDELYDHLDSLIQSFATCQIFSIAIIHQKIAEICRTPEELTCCIFVNTMYLVKHGFLLDSRKSGEKSNLN